MRRTRSTFFAAGAALSLTLVTGLALAGGQPGVASPVVAADAALPPETAPVLVGPADPAAVLEVGLVLRGQDSAGLARVLAGVGAPSGTGDAPYLTPAAFGDRFGLARADEDQLVATLEAAGLTVSGRVPQRTSLRVSGTVADLERVLGLSLQLLTDPRSGLDYVASLVPPIVPPSLAGAVTGILGVDPLLQVTTVAPADAPPPPSRGLAPRDLAIAYDFLPLWEAGITGDGQAAAILQFGVDTDEDLAVFDAAFGIQGPPVERISVGTGLAEAPADFATEAVLDTQVLRAAAPGARILVYGFPLRESMATAVDRIVADGEVQAISLSYGKCFLPGPPYISEAEVALGNLSFAAAALAGVSLYAASGDWGAFSCHVFNNEEHRESTFWPSCTDNVVGVGGTFLETRADGTWLRETGWQDYLTTGGTGGGISPVDPMPAWQQGPGVQNDRSNGKRQCPDVSAAADPDTGYLIFETKDGEGAWNMVGGTSAAAPLWTGLQTLMQQAAAAQGIDRLGFMAPRYYRIAQSDPTAFHDVTRGGNLIAESVAGWDYATGVGTPSMQLLTDAVIRDIEANP